MNWRFLLFLSFIVNSFAKNCPNKKVQTKLICYYSKLTNVDPCYCTHVIVPADSDLKVIEDLKQKLRDTKILLTVNEFHQDLVKNVKKKNIDGLEINLQKLDSKNDIMEFINTVRSRLGNNLYLAVSVPPKPELLAKFYDMKALSKLADLFILQTAFLGSSTNVTFHPSRLSGLWDMQNTDSVVDLVTGLGTATSKLAITLPVQSLKFTLQDESLTTPGSPAIELTSLTRSELCSKMSSGDDWTLERDQDQAGPYIFRGSDWISFEDPTSIDIKAKYARVRGLAGLALKDLSQDEDTAKCGGSLLNAAYAGLSKQNRAPRGAVLRSLEREILETPAPPLETVRVSPYRISRVIDVEGHVHTIRKDTRTEFECSRQGYFVHPHSCGRFYRCVKFDQQTDEFSVFEFDCPAGLAFDERVEVCVWPGSLPDGAPCTGSSEIAPVPKERFVCPTQPGYYADAENCRWFFACLDHGKSGLTAYEFRCPFGLVFDEKHLVCEWPWLVPTCQSGTLYGLGLESVTFYGAGEKLGLVQKTGARITGLIDTGHILQNYDGLGSLGTITLGGYNGDLNLLKSAQAFGQGTGVSQHSGAANLVNNGLYTIGSNADFTQGNNFGFSNVQQHGVLNQGVLQPGVAVFGTKNNANGAFLLGSVLGQDGNSGSGIAFSNTHATEAQGGDFAGGISVASGGTLLSDSIQDNEDKLVLLGANLKTDTAQKDAISHIVYDGVGFGGKLNQQNANLDKLSLSSANEAGISSSNGQTTHLHTDNGYYQPEAQIIPLTPLDLKTNVLRTSNANRGSIKYSLNNQQNTNNQVNIGLTDTGLNAAAKGLGHATVINHGATRLGGDVTLINSGIPQTTLVQGDQVDQISTISQGHALNLGSNVAGLKYGSVGGSYLIPEDQVSLVDSGLSLNKGVVYGKEISGGKVLPGVVSYTNINHGTVGGQIGILNRENYAGNSASNIGDKLLTSTVELATPTGFAVTNHGNNYGNAEDKVALVNEGVNVGKIVYETNDQLDVINDKSNLGTATLNSNIGNIYNNGERVLVNSGIKSDLSSVQYNDNAEKYISNPKLIPLGGATSSVQFHKTIHDYGTSQPQLVENKFLTLNNGYQGVVENQHNAGTIVPEAKVLNKQFVSPATSTVTVHGQSGLGSVTYNNQYANDAKFVQPIISQTFTTHEQNVGDTDRYNSGTVVLNTPKLKYNIQQPNIVTYAANLAHDIAVTDTPDKLHTIHNVYGESADNFNTKSTVVNYATSYPAVTPKTDIFKLAFNKFSTPATDNKQITYTVHQYQTPAVHIQENIKQLPDVNINIGAVVPLQPKVTNEQPYQADFYGTKIQRVPVLPNQPVAVKITPKYDTQFSAEKVQTPLQVVSVTPKSEQIVTIEHQPQFVESVTVAPKYDTQFYGKKVQQISTIEHQVPIQTISVTPKSEPVVTIQHQPQFVESVTVAPKYDTQFYGKNVQQSSVIEQVPIQTVSVAPKTEQIVNIQYQPQFIESVKVAPKFDTQFYGKKVQQISTIEHQVPIQTLSGTPKPVVTIQHRPQFVESITVAPKYETQFYGNKLQQISAIEHQQIPIQTVPVIPKTEQILNIPRQPQFIETVTVAPKYDTQFYGNYGKKVQQISAIEHQVPIQTVSVIPQTEQILNIQQPPQFIETVTAAPKYDTQFYGKKVQVSTIEHQVPIHTLSVTPKSEQIVNIQEQPQFIETVTAAPQYNTQFYGKKVQHIPTIQHQVPIQTVSVIPKTEQIVTIQHQPQFIGSVTVAPKYDTQFYDKNVQQISTIEHQVPLQTVSVKQQPQFIESVTVAPTYDTQFYGKKVQQISTVEHQVPIQTVSVAPKTEQIVSIQHQPQFIESVTVAPKYDTQFYGKKVQQISTVEHQVPIQTVSVAPKTEQIVSIQHQPLFIESVTVAPKYDTQFYGKKVQQISTVEHQVPIQTVSVAPKTEQIVSIQHQPQFIESVTVAPTYDTQFYGKKVQQVSAVEHQVPIQTVSVAPKTEQIISIQHQPQFVESVTVTPKYDTQFYGKKVQQVPTIEHQVPIQTISVIPKSEQVINIQHQPLLVETVTAAPKYGTQFYNKADQILNIQRQPVSVQTVSVTPKYQQQDVKISTVHQPSIISKYEQESIPLVQEQPAISVSSNFGSQFYGKRIQEIVQPITYETQQPLVEKISEPIKPVAQIYNNYSPTPDAKLSLGRVVEHNIPGQTVTVSPVQTIYSEPAKIKSTFYGKQIQEVLPVQRVTPTPTIVESYSYLPPKQPQVNVKYESRAYLPPKPIVNSVYISSTPKPVQYVTEKTPEVFVSTTPKYTVFQEFIQPKQTFEIKKKIQPTIISEYKYENAAYDNYQNNLNAPQQYYQPIKTGLEVPIVQTETVYYSTSKPPVTNINYGNKLNLQTGQDLYKQDQVFIDVPKVQPETLYYSSEKPVGLLKNYQTEYILSTPKPTFISTITPVIKQTPRTRTKVVTINKYNLVNNENISPTLGYVSTAKPVLTKTKPAEGSFYYYDSRYNTSYPKPNIDTSGQYLIETSDYQPEFNAKSIIYESERLVTTPKPVFISTGAPVQKENIVINEPEYVVTTYKPKLFSTVQPDYRKIVSTTIGTPIDTYSSEDFSSTIRPSIITTLRPKLRQKILATTTTVPAYPNYENEYYNLGYTLSTTRPVIATTIRPVVKKKKILTTTSIPLEAYSNYDDDEYIVSSERPFENVKLITPKPKGKTIVRVNDFHPFLTTKLGAQCTCVSNTVKLRKKTKAKSQDVIDYDYNLSDNIPITKITSSGPASYDDYNEPGVYIVGNSDSYDYDYEPQKIVAVTNAPQVRIKSTTNAIRPAPTPIYLSRKRITSTSPVEISSVTAVPEIDVSSTLGIISRKKSKEEKIADAVNEGLSLVKSAIKGYVAEAIETHKFDRYGPGGWRSRDETLQGTVDCQRAGLFRHPTQCNKFYACHWDCTKQRYTLHVFNCPVHLTFDASMGACNWPSKGPACSDNTLLPNV